jgi:AraC-like DNA-binding protein/quercetin dioxygenase-like cupin family protein
MTAARHNVGDGFEVRSLGVTYSDGHVLDRHTHPWGQLIYATAGVMRVVTDAGAYLVPPTRAIWAPALTPHAITMKGRVAMRTLYVAPELTEHLGTVAVLEVRPLLRELILYILGLQMLRGDDPRSARLAGLLVDLIGEAAPQDLWLPLPRDRRALAMAGQIQAAPDDRRSLAALAGGAGASLRTLQRLFSEETGLSLDAWRQKARLVHGAAALATGSPVTLAALDSGYESPSAFIAAFKRQFGVTPGRFSSPDR